MASGATSIDDLPVVSGDKANITLETIDNPVQTQVQENISQNTNSLLQQGQQGQQGQISQDDINKIIQGIQLASQTNMTQLPSSNIPMNQNTIHNDPETQPNYVPGNSLYSTKERQNKNTDKHSYDYINEEGNLKETLSSLSSRHKNRLNKEKQEDELFDIIQIPLLISILFFIFQLPFINKKLLLYIPSLFHNDGNISLGGNLLKSGLFGIFYFISMKLINYLSD